ncbi:ABC transporter ATP-binding protein [Vibrio tubiashii]|uniref:ABC transporter ATP-binding protein n=1 Tax=Vibrio tubiashii ATCC 19109 TaxID=1051646 RepID=F9T4E7_9VIBR|nr:ABC transporter ATP-binding protein [Vibrio tubiashii]AIW13327.1 ABC transporter ATP-binding protein [Vibrio tubiashii ATCC 19109]EGU56058.1 ABC transporter, ATP binding protein [Vibrio tubiashii ATCC 19109]EIF04463.1 ABC transporter ATP-binding protein [Vibrio tubiashii NCIMB 1337 = ATCC 19106]
MLAIEGHKISKSYRGQDFALRDIDLHVKQGECYGVLGRNGAGKSTLIKILSTQLPKSAGTVSILGMAINKPGRIRGKINIVNGGEHGLYPWLSGYETLDYFYHLYRMKEVSRKRHIEHLLTLVGLEPNCWHRPTHKYSKGMKQRLHIARGLVNHPEVVFMDEPTIGLDVEGVESTRQLIKDICGLGKTIVLTSHNIIDIERSCNNIQIIDQGISKGCFNLSDLAEQYSAVLHVRVDASQISAVEQLLGAGSILEIAPCSSSCVTIKIATGQSSVFSLLEALHRSQVCIAHYTVENCSLEHFYLSQVS